MLGSSGEHRSDASRSLSGGREECLERYEGERRRSILPHAPRHGRLQTHGLSEISRAIYCAFRTSEPPLEILKDRDIRAVSRMIFRIPRTSFDSAGIS